MKSNYTLNRFYYEAKALLEKHNVADDQYLLHVSFDINEGRKPGESRHLNCTIRYSDNREYRFFSGERTPALALDEFEKNILKSKGKNFDIDSVSVQLDD